MAIYRAAPAALILAFILGTQASALPPQERPSPGEVKAWSANGPSYGYTCRVVAKAGAKIWQQMGAKAKGTVSRGTEIVIDKGDYDRQKRTWYRVDFIDRSSLKGWVAAIDLSCRPEHFN